MFKNYLKTTLRNLSRYKFYSFINVIGLGIGIAAMVWSFQNYRAGFGFDKFHPDIDHVYRGLTFRQGADGEQGLFPMPAVNLAKIQFPGITEVARLTIGLISPKGCSSRIRRSASFFSSISYCSSVGSATRM
jgi:putative ABC transport system permease protein